MKAIENLKTELETAFPEMSFSIGKRIYGQCIIAKKSKYSGADIFVKDDGIIVEAAIPEMKTRLLIGSGAVLLKLFNKNYSEPSLKIKEYLSGKYDNVKLRQ